MQVRTVKITEETVCLSWPKRRFWNPCWIQWSSLIVQWQGDKGGSPDLRAGSGPAQRDRVARLSAGAALPTCPHGRSSPRLQPAQPLGRLHMGHRTRLLTLLC